MSHGIHMEREAYDLTEELPDLPVEQAKARIRQGLIDHGTDVELNDRDINGDGDQSPIELDHDGKQFYRDLFAIGGDLNNSLTDQTLSLFAMSCIMGNAKGVKEDLEKASKGGSFPSENLVALLERRETSMRLSPVMMIIAMGKNIILGERPTASGERLTKLEEAQAKTVSVLLQYGARPDARDVCGKTVCHYGMANMATKMTLRAVDMCIEAQKSSHLFGKEVVLCGLNNEAMNGKRGIAKGFFAETGRRAVYLHEKKAEVSIKPDNIKLIDADNNNSDRTKLCDIQDRLGGVCLLELMMGNRVDVVSHILAKHHPNVNLEDSDGCSPKSMSLTAGAGIMSQAAPLVQKYAMKQARADLKASENCCGHCGKRDVDLLSCARCQKVKYCSKSCQKQDWKEGGHKAVCRGSAAAYDAGIVIDEPQETQGVHTAILNFKSRKAQSEGSYCKPRNMKEGDKFYVKVQAGGEITPLLIYDKTRECMFYLQPQQRGFRELYATVRAEKASQGRKAYMKASFDARGKMRVYPNETTIKTW